jgi:hypothetical protein
LTVAEVDQSNEGDRDGHLPQVQAQDPQER